MNKGRRKKYLLVSACICFSLLFICFLYFPENRSRAIFTCTIKNNKYDVAVSLEKKSKKNYLLKGDIFKDGKYIQTSIWPLNYEIFRIDTGDVNSDQSTEILVGVVKPARFDPVPRRRIFIFKLFEGYIRPLWLGSRVSQPLIDFRVHKGKSIHIIRTIELEHDNSYLVAEYSWTGFGLNFDRYLIRKSGLSFACELLNMKL